jgi:hypothetical protein
MPGTLKYLEALKYEHMTVAGTVIERDGQAKLHSVVVNSGAATSLDIFNGPNVSSPVVASIDCTNENTYSYNGVPLSSGIAIRLYGTADITVIYE